MSLPPALLERLRKRGVIKEDTAAKQQDEPPTVSKKIKRSRADEDSLARLTEDAETAAAAADGRQSSNRSRAGEPVIEAVGCPNKYNLTHFCNQFCKQKFGNGVQEIPDKQLKLYERLIAAYGLSDDWVEVWEPGVARFYFWQISTNLVSWLPPTHPKAKISLSAIRLKAGEKQVDVNDNGGSKGKATQANAANMLIAGPESEARSEDEEDSAKANVTRSRSSRSRSASDSDYHILASDEDGDQRTVSNSEDDDADDEDIDGKAYDSDNITPDQRSDNNDDEDYDSDNDAASMHSNDSNDSIDEKLESVFD